MIQRGNLRNRHQKQNEIVEDYLINYEDHLEILAQRLADLEGGTKSCLAGDGQPRGSDTSDPTGNKGRALTDPDLEKLRRWVLFIEEVVLALPPNFQIIVKRRREYRHKNGPYGWVYPVQQGFAKDMAELYKTSELKEWKSGSTIKNYLKEIQEIVARLAMREKLL